MKGVLTNLLENAAQAAGPAARCLGVTTDTGDKITIEVHDSGPGVSVQARSSLFQPSISFKRGGMGLGLSIARKSALLSGGDILLVAGRTGRRRFSCACFRRRERSTGPRWRESMPAKRILILDDEPNIGARCA